MITINDNDPPITVAEKIIRGTKPHNLSELAKAVTKVITEHLGRESPRF